MFDTIQTKETDKGVALYNKVDSTKISPSDKAIYGMAAEGKSAAEILKFIATASRNPFNRQVAKLLLKTGINPTVTVGDGKGWKMNAGEGNKYAAAFNPATNTVALFRPASSERNMIHELIHASTLKALEKNGMASAQMKALFAHVERTGKVKGMYGITNVDEFVAEAFSNPKFQAQLKKISAPSSSALTSAWHWFTRIVKGILGLPANQESALSQALEIGLGVMRENMKLSESSGDTRYAEDATTDQEFADTERAYGGREAYAKAKESGKTKLNYRQWVQVRTSRFKNWFGDWETLAIQNKFDAFVTRSIESSDPREDFSLRAVTEKEIAEILKQGGPDVTGMEHVFVSHEIKHAAKHGSDKEALIHPGQRRLTKDDLLRLPVVIDAYDSITVQSRATNKTSVIYAKKFDDGRIEYVERVIETSGKNKPRLVTKTAWVVAPTGVKSSLARVYTPERNYSLPFENGRVNPGSVSKAIDQQTSEPMVVYHGTMDDIEAFDESKGYKADPGWLGRGFYFTTNTDTARYYATNAKTGKAEPNILPIYLSLKDPYYATVRDKEEGALRSFGNKSEFAIAKRKELMAKGHDGVILDFAKNGGFAKELEIVAFDPAQIKSAIGNNGDFDGSNPDIRYNITGDSGRSYDQAHLDFFKNVGRDTDTKGRIAKTLEYLKKDFAKKMAVGIVDQFRGLRDLNDGGQAYLLARLSKGTAGAFETLLHHGKLSIKDGAYDGDQSGGFIEKLGVPLHGELDDFLWYVAANRADGLAKNDRENLFTPQDIAAGKSLASGTTKFDYTIQTGPGKGKVTRNRAMIFADANRVFNEFQKNTLDIAEQSGLIDGAARKFWESEFYVPFYRVSEEDGEFIGAKMGNSLVRQQAFKKLKGGTDKLNSDLLSNTLLNWSHLIEASAKNRAAKATLVAAEKVGAAHKASYGEKKTVWYMGDITKTIPAGQEYTENGVKKVSDGTDQITYVGKVEYGIDDPFVMTAITSLEYAGMRNGIMDVMTTFKHWLTIGVTASPAFKVRNLIRDSVQAIGTSDLGYNPIKNVVEGFKQSSRDKQEYVSALASGGLIRFGTMLEGSESARVRQLVRSGVKDSSILNSENKWREFYDKFLEPGVSAYNELGNRSEEINRAALYNQLIKQGKSHAEAALMARDLMDFSMQGSFNTIRFLTQIVPFMNARLQGMYKLGRSAKDNPRKMAIVAGAVAMASIALMLSYGDDDDWKRREDFDRDNFWWFKFAGIEWRIPKPFEIGAVGTLAERSLEFMIEDEMTGDRFKSVVSSLVMNNLSMNPVPQMLKPIVDLYANKDSFTKRPIESMGMQRLEPTMRYNSSTSMVGRGLSNVTGGILSPVQYDHLARAYFGWLGSFVIGGADMGYRLVSDEPTQPTRDYFKFATQGILKEQGTGSSRYLSQMYEQAKELEQAHATYRQLLKDGKIEDAKEYAEDNKEALSRYRQVEGVKKIAAKFNERIRAIERSDIDADQKKEQIANINKMKESVAKRLSESHSEL